MKSTLPHIARQSTLALLLLVAAGSVNARGQSPDKTRAAAPAAATGSKLPVVSATMSPLDLARAAFNAQGGEKFRHLKNMMLIGSVDLYAPNSTQSVSGKFGMILAGDKLRQEIQTPIVSFQLIFDGERSHSSLRGINLPPLNRFGLPVLARFDQAGYTVSALPDRKKQRAFRLEDAEGNGTDFYVDATTGRVVSFEITYNRLTYIFEYRSFRELDGVLVPVQFAQKLAAPQGDYVAEFKVKEAKLNQDLPDDAFAIRQQ